MQEPQAILPTIRKPDDALPAFTQAARMYHDVADRLRTLQCTLLAQSVVLVNGSRPTPRESCTKAEPD